MRHIYKSNRTVISSFLGLCALAFISACDDSATTSSVLSWVLGQSSTTASSSNAGGAVSSSGVESPRGMIANGTKLFVADSGNSRVLIWNTIPTATGTAPDVVVGQANFTTGGVGGVNGGNGAGNASSSTMNSPQDVWTNGTKLIVADASNNRVLIWNTVPTTDGAAADVVVGQTDFTSESANQGGGANASTLSSPIAVFSDGTRLFIADSFNNRVLIFNTIPTSSGATADVILGQAMNTSTGSGTTASTMNFPQDVYSDGTRVFVADRGNNRVLIWTSMPGATGAAANLVLGQSDLTSGSSNQGGAASASTLSGPRGVFSDGTRLFVSDAGNNRVLQWDSIPSASSTAADKVYGQNDFTTTTANGGSIGIGTLSAPETGHSDGTNLMVPDAGNHRMTANALK